MAKRELRESIKSEIDNLFKSPEQAESDFQRFAKRRKKEKADGTAQSPSGSETTPKKEDKHTPRLTFRFFRFSNGQRVDCGSLAHLVHFTIFGSTIQQPKWVSLSNHRNVLQTLVIRINVEDNFFETTNLSFPNDFFEKRWLELDADISDRNLFWTSLMNVRLTLPEQIRRKCEKMQKTFDGQHDKTHFVLSTEQLAERNYPFPGEEGIVPTKERYLKLTSSSPLFSIDCEMCETSGANRALTRISIIDEQERTLLDTLVKPPHRITDYLTKFSGITETMMEGVTTTLEDVQQAVRALLPPDAILVGHSLEHDLQAMKMTHPYCLDVGYALNFTNCLGGVRNSLKSLTDVFLGEKIQSSFGHCSYEDAWAALRLAQLKLEKGLVFGNTSYGWKYTDYAKNNGEKSIPDPRKNLIDSVPCSDCSNSTVVGCTVVDCRCRFVSGPSKCVQCVKQVDCVQGNINWAESLGVDKERTSSPIETFLKKDKMMSVMCAFDRNGLDFQIPRTKKIRSKDPSSFRSHETFIDNVASEMLNDSVIFLEIDKEKLSPLEMEEKESGEVVDNSEALNQKLEKLVAATTKNACIVMVFSSSKKNIMYVRIK